MLETVPIPEGEWELQSDDVTGGYIWYITVRWDLQCEFRKVWNR